ncbi:uncharacterized protein METZ01_LOCUS142926 [marine metagenome]|uniref:Uncharacterized protein n=1 Tax=marine metagenome TaxID=408172 RepID=A0A381ZMI7_9ZZZZ
MIADGRVAGAGERDGPRPDSGGTDSTGNNGSPELFPRTPSSKEAERARREPRRLVGMEGTSTSRLCPIVFSNQPSS